MKRLVTLKTKDEFTTKYPDGVPSNDVVHIEEDDSVVMATNNVDGEYKIYGGTGGSGSGSGSGSGEGSGEENQNVPDWEIIYPDQVCQEFDDWQIVPSFGEFVPENTNYLDEFNKYKTVAFRIKVNKPVKHLVVNIYADCDSKEEEIHTVISSTWGYASGTENYNLKHNAIQYNGSTTMLGGVQGIKLTTNTTPGSYTNLIYGDTDQSCILGDVYNLETGEDIDVNYFNANVNDIMMGNIPVDWRIKEIIVSMSNNGNTTDFKNFKIGVSLL